MSIPKNTDAAAIAAERIEIWFDESKAERRDAALLSVACQPPSPQPPAPQARPGGRFAWLRGQGRSRRGCFEARLERLDSALARGVR